MRKIEGSRGVKREIERVTERERKRVKESPETGNSSKYKYYTSRAIMIMRGGGIHIQYYIIIPFHFSLLTRRGKKNPRKMRDFFFQIRALLMPTGRGLENHEMPINPSSGGRGRGVEDCGKRREG